MQVSDLKKSCKILSKTVKLKLTALSIWSKLPPVFLFLPVTLASEVTGLRQHASFTH